MCRRFETMALAVAYQATDLARNHRQVLDDARRGGALLRDKDGLALLVAPAEDVNREREVAALALDLVRAALAILKGDHSAAGYGALGWLSVLPDEDQRQFFTEMSNTLLVASSGLGLRSVELLLGDWKATAESWADPDLREALLADADEPLHDSDL
jgi:hypothetical protein